jgi:hypothetical protein
LDFAIGGFLRLQQPKFITFDDWLDLFMCGLAILIVVIYPLWVCIFMHLNVEKFEDKEFK